MRARTIKYADGAPIENKNYRWIVNMYPKFEGHTMVIPKKHVTEIGKESPAEITDREELVAIAAKTLCTTYSNAGIEVFLQTGTASEASIEHLHWHVVPSQLNDPLRGFDKLGHFFTIKEGTPKILIFPVAIKKSPKVLFNALSKSLGRKDESNESARRSRRKRQQTFQG